MGLTKTDLYTADQNKVAALAKALAHPARIAIIEQIILEKKCINSTLVKELGLAQATISQHLKELKTAGLIQGTIEGTSMSYCIDPKGWIAIKTIFNRLFDTHSCC